MSRFIKRLIVGGGLAALGAVIAGPAGAYAGWKGGGFLATGNPLHLVPGLGAFGDGMDAVSSLGDLASITYDAGDATSHLSDIHTAAGGHDLGLAAGDTVWSPGLSSANEIADSAGQSVWGTPLNANIQGVRPLDIFGGEVGRTITGGLPTDIHGNPI